MLTYFYVFLIIWSYLVVILPLRFRDLLLGGWVLWGINYAIIGNATYWLLDIGRLPIGNVTFSYEIVNPSYPTLELWILGFGVALMGSIVWLLSVIFAQRCALSVQQLDEEDTPRIALTND